MSLEKPECSTAGGLFYTIFFIYLYCPRNPDDTQIVRWEGYIKFDITSYVLYLSCQLSIDPSFT